MRTKPRLILLVSMIVLVAGCQSNDDRLVEMACEHVARQAEQSRDMARMQHEVAQGSRRLVESDAKAREDFATMQAGLRADAAEVGRQRDALEAERRQIVQDRRWDSVAGDAIVAIGTLLACLVPLVVCLSLLRKAPTELEPDAALVELLVREVAGEQPLLLPASGPIAAIDGPKGSDSPSKRAKPGDADPS